MTLEDGTELSPALGIGAFIEKTLVAAGQCTKVDPAARPTVAGLLGCGVMAGLGAAINTGNVGRGRLGRRDRLRRGRGGRDRRRPAGRGGHDHRRRHRRPQAGQGHASSARRTPINSKETDAGRGHPGADRRLRRRRGDRRRRAARDLEAGVLRPRPGRHRRAGRRADPDDAAGAAAAGRLRPRRLAEVVLVRRLPADPGLPDADRPVPAGPAAAGRVRHRGDRHRRHRGGLRQDARRRRAALGRDHGAGDS